MNDFSLKGIVVKAGGDFDRNNIADVTFTFALELK